MSAAEKQAPEFDRAARCACLFCDEGTISVERDDDGEPILSHHGPRCAIFEVTDERKLLRLFADAVRAAPWR